MSKKSYDIKHLNETPEWLVDNKHLKHGYRVGFNSIKLALKSLFMKHNETMNIWTHAIGVILFAIILFILVGQMSTQESTYNDFSSNLKTVQLSECQNLSADQSFHKFFHLVKEKLNDSNLYFPLIKFLLKFLNRRYKNTINKMI